MLFDSVSVSGKKIYLLI